MYPFLFCVAGFLFLCVLCALAIAKIYNRLVAMKNQTDNGFHQISIQLKRRYDLIPNLVECVKANMGHERETLEAVIAARNDASASLSNAAKNPTDAGAVQSLAKSEGMLTGALNKMSFVMEAYPELKASESVAQLTEELTSTENRIAFARQAYNDWATAFNVTRQTFPTVIIAGKVGFNDDFALLEFEDAEEIKHAPQVALAR